MRVLGFEYPMSVTPIVMLWPNEASLTATSCSSSRSSSNSFILFLMTSYE